MFVHTTILRKAQPNTFASLSCSIWAPLSPASTSTSSVCAPSVGAAALGWCLPARSLLESLGGAAYLGRFKQQASGSPAQRFALRLHELHWCSDDLRHLRVLVRERRKRPNRLGLGGIPCGQQARAQAEQSK